MGEERSPFPCFQQGELSLLFFMFYLFLHHIFWCLLEKSSKLEKNSPVLSGHDIQVSQPGEYSQKQFLQPFVSVVTKFLI